jgi:hypothetical protein
LARPRLEICFVRSEDLKTQGNKYDHYSLRPHEGKALFVLGDVVTLKLSTAETNTAYSLIEIMSVPGSGPAFLHTHGPQETFWILEGDHEIYGGMEMGRNMRSLRPPTMGKACHVGIGSRHACFLQ